MQEKVIILDFGSQYTQLIARCIRELNVYCEIYPWDQSPELDDSLKGVIFSGSPFSVHAKNAPEVPVNKYHQKLPVLAICFGAQAIASQNGGKVEASNTREYGRANLSYVNTDSQLLNGVELDSQVWMSHGDTIEVLSDDYRTTASTADVKFAGFEHKKNPTFGLQFHPEVYHTLQGKTILENFIKNVCDCNQNWTPDLFVESTVRKLKKQINKDKVVMGLSGGVDSSVAATLLHQAIGDQLYCIFVDNGLLRKNEYEEVLESYKGLGLNVKGVDAKTEFYASLEGITDPEQKRKAIGKVFIETFEKEANAIKDVKWLGQGTIYPDVIESVSSTGGPSATIKSHHNVGGLPDHMNLQVVEPLNLLFKDEVRRVGKSIDVPELILKRHPFPGPGLGIRILGEVNAERVKMLQDADSIFINGLMEHNLYDDVWQAGAVLLPVNSVGVMGDERTYENAVALRAVTSIDGMTADWCHLPYEFLASVSSKIINQVSGINRVTYDISSKPPATIEWE